MALCLYHGAHKIYVSACNRTKAYSIKYLTLIATLTNCSSAELLRTFNMIVQFGRLPMGLFSVKLYIILFYGKYAEFKIYLYSQAFPALYCVLGLRWYMSSTSRKFYHVFSIQSISMKHLQKFRF